MNLLQETERAYALASQGQLPVIELFSITQLLIDQKHLDIAIQLYQLWLERTKSPINYAVQFNLAVALANADDDISAENAYKQALEQKPDFLEASLNLGTLLERTGRAEQALSLWHETLALVSKDLKNESLYVELLNNLGRLLEIEKQLPEAEAILTLSLRQNSKQPHAIVHWVHLRQKLCLWPIYKCKAVNTTQKKLIEGTSPLAMLSAFDDPELQLKTASRYVKEKVLTGVPYLSTKNSYGHTRLRIAYLSSDFCSHAVSILTAELYGLHDRSQFEVYGFCWSRVDGSSLQARVIAGMDHHIKIGDLNDEEAAKLIRSHEIDILIDLHGLTLGSRHDILSYRPAPLQLTWLGFPGSTALPEIDYVLCDSFVFPPELEPYFSEKPLRLPQVFQVNDRQRLISPRPTRESCGLPEEAFVFCSFNNTYKITPEVFKVWMRILKRVPQSILWLIAENATVRTNLHEQAKKQGISTDRILFAERALPSDYLARFQVADLFLDTFPFGGGTTASDALWAGLPFLTYSGKTFASRMAGSLLNTVELTELITYSLSEYENKAVELANQPERIEIMKQHLIDNRLSFALFDTPRFVRDLEALYNSAAATLNVNSQASLSISTNVSSSRFLPLNNSQAKKVLIEGWKEINHSFAMVNQYQLLELVGESELALFHKELPYPSAAWVKEKNGAGFNTESTQLIDNIAKPTDQEFDCVYTIGWPFRRASVQTKKTITFMVTEFGLDGDSFLEKGHEISALVAGSNIIVTPSVWSKEKIVGFGIPRDKVVVVPHGIDSDIFYPPSRQEKQAIREQLGVSSEHFVFLNVGGMHWNKGVDLLVLAFAAVRKKHTHVKLVLKDNRKIYGITAESIVHDVMRRYPDLIDESIIKSIILLTSNVSLDQLRLLYGAVDSYASPYRAEGFNLPVIESIASGTKVIVSKGGATDDFCNSDIAWFIDCNQVDSRAAPIAKYGYHLEPKIDSLIAQMELAILDQGSSEASFSSGRDRLIKEFSWASCTKKLVALMTDDVSAQSIIEIAIKNSTENQEKTLRIYCDGGFANRYNNLVSGLAICNILNVRPEIVWPTNSWCAASFVALFDSNLVAEAIELIDIKHNHSLDRYTVISNQDQANFLEVPYLLPNSLDDFSRVMTDSALGVFYHFPLIPDWIPKEAIEEAMREVPFKQALLNTAESYISEYLQEGYIGIHLRRTDLVLGFTDDEVKAIATEHSDKLIFICSDSEETERALASVPNIRIKKKTAYVELKDDNGNWLSPTLDDSGRAYYSNVKRSEQSVLDAVVDLLILSRSNIMGTGGSTFFGLAKLLKQFYLNTEISKRLESHYDLLDFSQQPEKMALLKKLLTPRKVGLTKCRVGAKGDGGYVLAKELIPEHRIVYSLGIGDNVSFDMEISKTCDRVLQFDGTIPNLPQDNSKFVFVNSNVDSAKMNASMYAIAEEDHQYSILLKMDIEGSEYELLGGLTMDNLLKFSQICMELHYVTLNKACLDLLISLTAEFDLFHLHVNNNVLRISGPPGYQSVVDDLPDLLELTFVRKDKCLFSKRETQSFPIEGIDYPNISELPDLSASWWL